MIIKRIFRTALSMILALSMMTAGMASRTVNAAAEESRENSGGVVTDDVSDVSSAQYAYATDGSHYLDFDAGIHVPNWNQDAGNMDQDVIVAVLDTGIDWRHPELADRIVTFTEEQQRILGCGAHGFDAIPDEKGDAMEDPDFYATEVLTHATHCAGIIGAAWDKKGISGAASRARLLNIRVTNEDGMLSTTAVLRAFSFIKEAYKLGIKTRIASCSWYIGENSRAVDTAVRDLGENCGILTFFAAGNEGIDVNDYGSTTTMAQSNPYAVLVGATNIKAVKPNFSSYSRTGVDVMAPGTAILSTIPLSGIDDEPAYFSDLAPKGTNLFYAGANSEGEIDIQMEGAPATVGITDEASFLGRTSYRISTADKLQPDDTFSLTLSAKGLKKPVDFEKGGYRLSLINMSKYETIMINTASVKNTSGGWSEAEDLGSASIRSSWMNEEFVLPADTDFDDFQMRLELYLLDVTEPSPVTFYLDSIGIGNQLSNYGIKTGTSMACPTAAGAAAVMLSSHLTQDMEYESGYDVMQLKADIIGPTRVIDGAEEYINSAGIVDLSVKKENYCPSISDVTINGNELKLSGYYFGDAQGSVSTELITAGVHKPIHTSIRSWTDREVVLDLNDTIAGRLQIALTAANGRKYTFLKQFDRSENVFEKEYDFPTGTDDPYAINSIQDGEASGAMFGLKGKLYFLQEVLEYETCYYYTHFYTYDTARKKWDRIELKEPLENASAVIYKGKILIEGRQMGVNSVGLPIHKTKGKERLYLYDPGKKTWKRLSNKNVSVCATLARVGKKLYLVGNRDFTSEGGPNTVNAYDTKKGAKKKPIAQLSYNADNAKVAVRNNNIYIYAWTAVEIDPDSRITKKRGFALQRVNVKTKKTGNLTKKLPEHGIAPGIPDYYVFTNQFSLAAVNGGIVIAGMNDKNNGKNVWYYNEKKNTLKPYKKQISDGNILCATLADYKGQLYAIAMDAYEQNKMVFRSTSCG